MYTRAHVYFALAFAVTIAGFYPSYVSRLDSTDTAHHFHGITASLWFLMLIGQSLSISNRNFATHRAFGKSSYLLAPLLLIGGVLMMISTANSDFPLRYTLLFIDHILLSYFALFYLAAIANKRNVVIHSRCMTATIMAVLSPALARFLTFYVPGVESLTASLSPTMIIIELLLLAMVISDIRRREICWPYPVALVIVVIQHRMMFPMGRSPAWQAYCDWIAGLPI